MTRTDARQLLLLIESYAIHSVKQILDLTEDERIEAMRAADEDMFKINRIIEENTDKQ